MCIGYACLAIGVPGSEMKSCTSKNLSDERLYSLIGHNIEALGRLIDYNIQSGIRLFRISSDLIPFGSSLAEKYPWQDRFAYKLSEIGFKIRSSGMRVSMHPGQYTVLNSPDISVTERACKDLDYHAKILDSLNLGPEHKIILHLGGVYGDKIKSTERFISRYKELSDSVRRRLVLENDDRLFNISDVLRTAASVGIPAVYDTLHSSVNPADETRSDIEWIIRCSETWTSADGPQKIHYSQQAPDKRPGAHSKSVAIDTFLEFYEPLKGMDIDIMLEVKDKNLSALKCLNCTSDRGITRLETDWANYKYLILERSPENYQAIRELLRNKSDYPALSMYRIIEKSLLTPITAGSAANAAEHVWGYFKDKASDSEKRRIRNSIEKIPLDVSATVLVKKQLLSIARKYEENYLLNGYYFYI